MESFKFYIIRIIVLCAVVQLGSLLISNDGFKKLYKLIGSVLLMISFVSFPSCSEKIDFNIFENEDDFEVSDTLNTEFTDRVENLITDDLKKTFNLDFFKVEVLSDNYESICVKVYGFFSNDEILAIKTRIENKFCTADDEVIVKNELH